MDKGTLDAIGLHPDGPVKRWIIGLKRDHNSCSAANARHRSPSFSWVNRIHPLMNGDRHPLGVCRVKSMQSIGGRPTIMNDGASSAMVTPSNNITRRKWYSPQRVNLVFSAASDIRSEFKEKSVAFKAEGSRKGWRKSPSPPRRSAEAEEEISDNNTSDSHTSDENFAAFTRQFQRFMKKKKWRTRPSSSSYSKDEYYKKKKTPNEDRYASKPGKQSNTKIMYYCCNRTEHVIADCPDKRKESKDKMKQQIKGKKEKSLVAQKEKSWTDSSSSESGEEKAEAYVGLFSTEEESRELEFL
ncbi:hypothetical protein KSP39_PZI023433 [Platanthera zijinensis]|uniref:Uncharacterized protein n=1 Tax=Platanthera zijinensis TaxID=2320716 RepID=A0AAP0FTZ0_9ASPA